MKSVITLLLLIIIACSHMNAAPSASPFFQQYWMCLARCGDDKAASLKQLDDIDGNTSTSVAVRSRTRISFEAYDLGPDSQVIRNPFENMTRHILKKGFVPVMMFTSASEAYLMQADPHSVAPRLVAAARSLGVSGVDMDIEVSSTNPATGKHYAHFVDVVSEHLHQHGLLFSADIATWSSEWNYPLIAKTRLQTPTLMSTYAAKNSVFLEEMNKGLNAFGANRVVLGLDTAALPTREDVKQRLDEITKAGSCRVAFWDTPIPSHFWEGIQKFVHRCVNGTKG